MTNSEGAFRNFDAYVQGRYLFSRRGLVMPREMKEWKKRGSRRQLELRRNGAGSIDNSGTFPIVTVLASS